MAEDKRLVWSSDGEPPRAETCTEGSPVVDGVVRVGRETKGRRGKTVTVIRGAPLDAAGLDDLVRELKRRCGTGGTVRGGAVEIQGDQRERVVAALEKRGWTVKLAGG